MALVPPTSVLLLVWIPGMSVATSKWVRPLGMASTTSLLRTRCWAALCTSTTGDSPVTVMVSSMAPTRMSALTVAVKDPVSSIFSRLTVLKPPRVKVTV